LPDAERHYDPTARHLFEGIEGFADLEARIAALPTERDRGDAFEVFAEA
jgi:hypothetical protein